MYQTDNDTSVTPMPTPAVAGVNPNSFFTNGNPSLGQPATILDADWANAVQQEICNVITGAGLALDKTVQNQLFKAIELMAQQDLSIYSSSTSAANTYTATLTPAPTAYTNGMMAIINFTNANTGSATINLNSLGAKSITHLDGTPLNAKDIAAGMVATLIYNGTSFQLVALNPSNYTTISQGQSGTINYAASTTAANTYTATLSPSIAAYSTGMPIRILFTNANTGAATLNLNGLGAISLVRSDGSSLSANDIAAGMMASLTFNGTNFVLNNINPSNFVSMTQNQTGSTVYAASAGSANTYTASLSPVITSYVSGLTVKIKFNVANTSASTLNLNSLGAVNIKHLDGSALGAGDIAAGMMATLSYDGTNFQLSSVATITAVRNIVTQTFTTLGAQTYTPSAGLIEADVVIVGAGASGGGINTTGGVGTAAASSGGGAGAIGRRVFSAAQIGSSATVTVGTGGAAPTAGGNNGNAGGATSIALTGTGTITMSAPGGAAGLGGINALATRTGGAGGGPVTNAQAATAGAPGGNAFSIPSTPIGWGGNGGDCLPYGGGGISGQATNGSAAGASGTGYGSGGAGSGCAQTVALNLSGGAGANGIVIIVEYCSQ